MSEDKGTELLQQLIKATKEGKVAWRPTARLNEYTSSFRGRFGILVGEETGASCYLRLLDADGNELLTIYEKVPLPPPAPPPPLLFRPSSSPAPSGAPTAGTDSRVEPSPKKVLVPTPAPEIRAGIPKIYFRPEVRELYELARRRDLQADQAIDEILQDLKRA